MIPFPGGHGSFLCQNLRALRNRGVNHNENLRTFRNESFSEILQEAGTVKRLFLFVDKDSDGLSDYGAWSDPRGAARRKEEKKRNNLPTESKQKLVAEELTKYKAMASEAKRTKNKSAQREAGTKIGELKREMTELGECFECLQFFKATQIMLLIHSNSLHLVNVIEVKHSPHVHIS